MFPEDLLVQRLSILAKGSGLVITQDAQAPRPEILTQSTGVQPGKWCFLKAGILEERNTCLVSRTLHLAYETGLGEQEGPSKVHGSWWQRVDLNFALAYKGPCDLASPSPR